MNLHLTLHKVGNLQPAVTWQQPKTLNVIYPHLISNKGAAFNYQKIEQIIWQFSTKANKLEVNAETIEQLELACSYVNQDASQRELDRLSFLIEKSLYGNSGKEVSKLLNQYCLYITEYRTILAKISKLSGNGQLDALINFMPELIQTQQNMFGVELADLLFNTKNTSLKYLNDRRIIAIRTDLNSAEKQSQLLELQKDYKNQLEKQQGL